MARDKRKSKQLEELKGDLRSKDKLINQLKKQLGRVAKQAKKEALTTNASNKDELLAEAYAPEERADEYCPKCNASTKPTILGNRKLFNCKKCGHRKTTVV